MDAGLVSALGPLNTVASVLPVSELAAPGAAARGQGWPELSWKTMVLIVAVIAGAAWIAGTVGKQVARKVL